MHAELLVLLRAAVERAETALRVLAEEAGSLGLKYLSVECSVSLGEALVKARNHSQARSELQRALAQSERLGLRMLAARSHYLLATALRVTGEGAEASGHYGEAQHILEEIRKESNSNTLLTRADRGPIYSESARWSGRPPA